MADKELVRILREGPKEWNRWRSEHPAVRPDLRGAYLREVDLSGAHLNGADLSRADCGGADFGATSLKEADLSGAHLSGADLWGADLRGADLRGAKLDGAHLNGADLCGADLRGTMFGWTVFSDMDLSEVKGLQMVLHVGPSTIGIDTIFKSKGRIPEAFLRGCGVPDEFITYMRSLVGQPIEYYSCFISYSSKDQAFADRLHADLQAKGVRCWFAPEDVQGGKKLHEQIDEAIRYHDKLLLVLSANSMASEWVKTEIRRARREEVKAGRRKLFPISLAPFDAVRDWEAFDADIGKDMAVEVREYFIPDFSKWKEHDAYRVAFERLVRDLKDETEQQRNQV